MSNILTDVLGFFKRRKFVKESKPDDVLILGINESPDMLGIASPVPYKDVKLIKIKDLKVPAKECQRINLGNTGEPLPFPPPANIAGIFKNVTTDAQTGDCFANFRSLKSVSLNLSITQNLNNIEFDTLGEPNTAANVGTGVELYQSKVGETLNFRTLVSGDNSVIFSQGADEIDIRCATYDLVSAQNGSNVNLNLAGSDGTTDTVQLIAGTGITLSDNGSNQITVSSADANTTYTYDLSVVGQNHILQLNGSDGTTDSITLTPSTNVAFTVFGDSIGISAANTTNSSLTLNGTSLDLLDSDGNTVSADLSSLDIDTTYTLNAAQNLSEVDIILDASVGTDSTVTLVPGTNVSLVESLGNRITINATDTDTNTTYDLGSAQNLTNVDVTLTGSDATTDTVTLAAGTNIKLTDNGSNQITIDATDTGEVNTASNLGAGQGVFAQKVAADLQFKSLVAGTNITLTPTGNDITIAASGGASGEANTASNVGTGAGVFKQKVGVDLELRKINAGSNVTITENPNDITIAATDTDTTYSIGSLQNVNNVELLLDASGTGTDTKVTLVAGTNITLTDNGSSQVTIDAAGGAASCATTSTIGGMIVGRVGTVTPSPGTGTAFSVEVNDLCEGYVTVPDPPVKASFQAIWNGTVNPYFNVTNGVLQAFPYDAFPLNYASVGAGQCVSATNVTPTRTTFDVAIGGTYKVSVNAHFFNLINGVNIDVEFFNNTTANVQGIINQEGIYGNDEDVNFFGEYIVPIAAGDNIEIRILFSGGGTNPFPANNRNLFCSMTLEKVD